MQAVGAGSGMRGRVTAAVAGDADAARLVVAAVRD
jgi:hypothetical protein